MSGAVLLSGCLLAVLGDGALGFSSSAGLQPDFIRRGDGSHQAAAWGGVGGPLREGGSPAGWWMASALLDSELLVDGAVNPRCRQLLNEFGESCSTLLSCLVKNARPVRVCERCFSHFNNFSDVYDKIAKDSGNVSCTAQLLRSDRLQIVLNTQKSLRTIWTDAQCDDCLNENKTALSTDTVIFKKLLSDSLSCFEQHFSKHPVHSNHSEVCIKCHSSYKNLTEYYDRMKNKGKLCIDTDDAMNLTRQLWSKTYNCTVHCRDMVSVIAISTFLLFLPVIFYLSSFLHSEQKKLKLIEPKRLKHSSSNTSMR
ncbi:osteopetrosis-associated transmembrane protein 1 [Hypanus sabinus]|uniref:osteopetrosis-associated transmembrane protein 1 n=1 Tax=Hypanus sabinus TaxID=79690 RepID=UPI0028C4830B|nr:osteopetrosis-associated transmembrane protein 1 [Hypanus sabinus]